MTMRILQMLNTMLQRKKTQQSAKLKKIYANWLVIISLW